MTNFYNSPLFIASPLDQFEIRDLISIDDTVLSNLHTSLTYITLYLIISLTLFIAFFYFKHFYFINYLRIKTFFWIPFYYFSLFREKYYYEIIIFSSCFSLFLQIIRNCDLSLFLHFFIINISLELKFTDILLAESNSGQAPSSLSGPAYGEAGPSNYGSGGGTGNNDDDDDKYRKTNNGGKKKLEYIDSTTVPQNDITKVNTLDHTYVVNKNNDLNYEQLRKYAIKYGLMNDNNKLITRDGHRNEDILATIRILYDHVYNNEGRLLAIDSKHRRRTICPHDFLDNEEYQEARNIVLEQTNGKKVSGTYPVRIPKALWDFAIEKDKRLREQEVKAELARIEQVKAELARVEQARSGHARNKSSISNLLNTPED